MIPCLAVSPVAQPIADPMPIPSVGGSMPKRESYASDAEFHNALQKWKRERVNTITSYVHTSLTNGTMTPELMERLKDEMLKVNLSTLDGGLN